MESSNTKVNKTSSHSFLVAVQTNLVPPKKVQPGMAKSSLVQASVATMQNPMGCDPKANGHCPLPRLSISSRSASVVASMDASCDGMATALHSVMKWKTVLAVFIVVMLYLVCGGLTFNALEHTYESLQKTSITLEKASFLERHPCVTPDELEALIEVSDFWSFRCNETCYSHLSYFKPSQFSLKLLRQPWNSTMNLLNLFITNRLVCKRMIRKNE